MSHHIFWYFDGKRERERGEQLQMLSGNLRHSKKLSIFIER